MALTLLSPLCLSGHYQLVYSPEAFFRFANGLHDKETTGLSGTELLFLKGGTGLVVGGNLPFSCFGAGKSRHRVGAWTLK